MLSHCHITNLAIVEHLDLDLQSGMTVITGETGAGKSILLDAIGLCFGDKAESTSVRPGAEKADISCTFKIGHLQPVLNFLKTHELSTQDITDITNITDINDECMIRRIIYSSGRSKAYINGLPVTTQQLKLLGEYLIQIHGQHQHQALLKPVEQLRLLDAFANHVPLLTEVQTTYQQWKKYLTEKQTLLERLSKDKNLLALLQYQVAELSELNLQEAELTQLDQQQNQLSHAQSDVIDAQSIVENLSESILNILSKTLESTKKLIARHPSLQTAGETLNSAHIQIQEVISDFNRFYQSIDINPEKLDEIEQRLTTIYDMARKYKVRPENLLSHFDALNTELNLLSTLDEQLLNLDIKLDSAKADYLQAAQKLSLSRQEASMILSEKIENWLEPLGMPGGKFSITLNAHEMSIMGLETAQFCVSANPGHPLQALHKVSSGGELSRISLAIQLIVAEYLNTPTLIFDEVDTGVGGKIGAQIGNALKTLGQSVQVLCVTHLPQVAAFGLHHIQVTKHRSPNNTYTTIETLSCETRVEELARMLGGIEITEQTRNHAKELLSIN